MAGEVAPDPGLSAMEAALAQAQDAKSTQALSDVVQTPSAKPAVESEGATVYANPANDPEQAALTSALQTPSAQPTLAPPRRQNLPGIVNLIASMIKPPMVAQAGQLARPVSRMATFEDFLGNFVQSLGQGFSNAGSGPASFSRGFGAAFNAPLIQAQQRQALQQQQAQTEEAQSRAALTQKQADLAGQTFTVQTPYGLVTMPMSQSGQFFKGFGAATVNAQAKLSVAQLEAMSKAGQVARVEDYRDPQSGQVGRMAYDRQGNPMGLLPGAYSPNQLPTVNTSQQWLQTSPGKWELVSKTSTSGKVLPMPWAASQSAPRSGFPGGPRTQPAAATAPPGKGAAVSAPSRRTILSDSSPIFAFDPKANERVLTTPAEAQQKGFTNPIPVREGDIDKYRASQVQFNDVQANVSRYRSAAQRFANEGSGSDAVNLNVILNQAKLGGGIHLGPAGIEIPGYSSLAEAADRVARSAAYKGLSPAGKDLVDGYFRTMAAVPAYQKALTAIGRSNKEMLDLELANIPNPTMAPTDILRKLQAFQENIDQGVSGIPRLPGIPTTRDIRQKFETQPQQQAAPAGNYSSMFFQ